MALRGRLEDFSVPQLFNLVHLARKTGALNLQKDSQRATIYFKEGKLVYASLNGKEKGLLNLLVKLGKITREQAQAIEARSRLKTDKEKALLLINAGYLTHQEIVEALQKHFSEIVYSVFTWDKGQFVFEPNILPDEDRLTVSMELANIILEGTRRMKEWERLREEIPDLDMALKFAERPSAKFRNINLTVDEWRVISYINPQNTIRQIAKHHGMSDYQIRKIVYGLLSAGLVELVEPPGRKKKPPPGIPPALQKPPAVKKSLVRRIIDRIRGI